MEIKINGKKSGTILVSEEDFSDLSKYKWHINTAGYAYKINDGKNQLMHRYIMKPSDDMVVDHKNGNRLDNRQKNLSICTTQKNCENKKISKSKTSSKYLGVFYNKNNKKYHVTCTHDKKTYSLGYYNDENTAAKIRDIYIVQNNLDHMVLNFPDKKEEYLKSDTVESNKKKVNKLGYYGITYNKRDKKYITSIKIKDKKTYISSSNTITEAAKTHDKYIVNNNIPGRKLNFPMDYPNYDPKKCVIKTFYKEIDDKTIVLNNDIIIDKEDYDKIKYYVIFKSSANYPTFKLNDKTTNLSRHLLNINDPKIYVDHIDSNTLNNCKSNLRLSNAILNAQNKSSRKDSSSKYVGIAKYKGVYNCGIKKDGKTLFTAYNKEENVVTKLRDVYIMKYLKDDHYKLNLEWTHEDKELWIKKLDEYIAEDHTVVIKLFNEKYDELKKWIQEHNIMPKLNSQDNTERHLAEWCHNKRVLKKNTKLKKEEIEQLEKIPGWYWDNSELQNKFFDNRVDELTKWVQENNKLPKSNSKNKDDIEYKLGNWCHHIRKNKKAGKLSDNEIYKLEQVSNWYWSRFENE